MQKFKFAEFSRKTVFRDFPVNYKEIPSQIGWKLTECIREQTDGRTDILQIISFDDYIDI